MIKAIKVFTPLQLNFKAGIIPALLLLPALSFSTNYYLSNSGNDNNAGTYAAPWKTITKLNSHFSTIQPGDSLFFKRGDTFFGSLIIGKSGAPGKPIVIAAYGKGANPVITGFTTISGFTKKEDGIWQAPAPSAKPNLNIVMLNGTPQRIGRYPNANDADDGYLHYESFSGNNAITDNELTGNINWTGAEVVIRKNLWTAERCRVTNQNDKTISYTYTANGINSTEPPKMYDGIKGFGYFFQNDYRTLDETGEWFFDTTNKRLYLFFGKTDPAACIVQASTVDKLIDAGSNKYITISNITLEGANMSGICSRNGSNIAVQYCSFNYIGAKAIHFWNTSDVLIDHVNTNFILSNAIQVRNGKGGGNVSVTNCTVNNTGIFIGMGSFFDGMDYKAVFASSNDHLLIENNSIDTAGLSGIQFQGNNVLVKNNVVKHFCTQLADGGGIYTWIQVEKEKQEAVYTNRLVTDNIILYAIGPVQGGGSKPKAEGIYMDGGTMNVSVQNNTIAFISDKGFETNNPINISFINNTCYSNGGGWAAARTNGVNELKNLEVVNNIFFSTSENQSLANFIYTGLNKPAPITIWEAIQMVGNSDNNYYNIMNPTAFSYSYSSEAGEPHIYPSPLSFDNWKELTRQDAHSKFPAKLIPAYTLKNLTGVNLVNNGSFENDANSVKVFGANTSGGVDRSAMVKGKSSLKIEFSKYEANKYSIIHGAIGSIMAGEKYLFRFKTKGTSECGILRASLRKTEAPYTSLLSPQKGIYGINEKTHEFLFDVKTSEAMASFVIEIEKNAGTTFVDEVELYEANATVFDINKEVRFEYNATNEQVNIPLNDTVYIGVDGTRYSKVLTLAPFSSKILIADKN
jgi:predicted outer membrane repeat protein